MAMRCREKINSKYNYFPEKDIGVIKEKIMKKADIELRLRISRVINLDLGLIEVIVDEIPVEAKVM